MYRSSNSFNMRCKEHQSETIEYICKSMACNNMALCKKCKIKHMNQAAKNHTSDIMPIKTAIQNAQKNLNKQIAKLEEYVVPFNNRKQTLQEIDNQIKDLERQQQRIISQIRRLFQKQRNELRQKNQMISQEQIKNFGILKKKIQQIQSMKQKTKCDSDVLRASLSFQIQPFLYGFGRSHFQMTSRKNSSSTQAYLYDDVRHNFSISRLQLKRRFLNAKLLKKVYNQSPLYFLIDPKYETTKYLHYFIPSENVLRVYNVQKEKWINYRHQNPLSQNLSFCQFFTTVFDYNINRFYMIGGSKGSRKSNQIIWFDQSDGKWGKSTLKTARSSTMSCIVKFKNSQIKKASYILIGGGLDDNERALKNWQMFDPNSNSIIASGDMNFSAAYGTFVNFEGSTVFKIGGLSNRNNNQLGICSIIEKCDFSQKQNLNQNKFVYIQLEDLKKDALNSGLKNYKLFYANQAAIQINGNQIFVFGGSFSNKEAVTETYIINIQKFQITNYQNKRSASFRYYARWINQKPLISAQDFRQLAPTIWNSRIYSLQNITEAYNKNQMLLRQKKLVEFDMSCWYETENIVDDTS